MTENRAVRTANCSVDMLANTGTTSNLFTNNISCKKNTLRAFSYSLRGVSVADPAKILKRQKLISVIADVMV